MELIALEGLDDYNWSVNDDDSVMNAGESLSESQIIDANHLRTPSQAFKPNIISTPHSFRGSAAKKSVGKLSGQFPCHLCKQVLTSEVRRQNHVRLHSLKC